MNAVAQPLTLLQEFQKGYWPMPRGIAEIDAEEAVRYQRESGSDVVCLLADAVMNLPANKHDKLDRLLESLMKGTIEFDAMGDLRDLLRSAMTDKAQASLNKVLQQS